MPFIERLKRADQIRKTAELSEQLAKEQIAQAARLAEERARALRDEQDEVLEILQAGLAREPLYHDIVAAMEHPEIAEAMDFMWKRMIAIEFNIPGRTRIAEEVESHFRNWPSDKDKRKFKIDFRPPAITSADLQTITGDKEKWHQPTPDQIAKASQLALKRGGSVSVHHGWLEPHGFETEEFGWEGHTDSVGYSFGIDVFPDDVLVGGIPIRQTINYRIPGDKKPQLVMTNLEEVLDAIAQWKVHVVGGRTHED